MSEKIKEHEFLGEIGNRNYYWNTTSGKIEWSVPDPRSAICADLGYKILAADYSQIEVKLMAFASGDPVLIAAINSGQDIHTFNATKIFGERHNFTYELMEMVLKDHTHPRYNELFLIRSGVKTVTFGVPYGAGVQKVAFMTGLDEDKALELINDFFNTFKVLKRWLESQGLLAVELGYSSTDLGRKRFYRIPDVNDPDAKQIVAQIKRWAGNMPIQAGNADILKRAMKMIYSELRGGNLAGPKLYDARFLLVVHDEIVLVCAEKDIEAVKAIMTRCMNQAYYDLVPEYGKPGFIMLGPEKYAYGVQVVEADIWAKA